MAARTLSHTQYETLVRYAHGRPSWNGCIPIPSLRAHGYLKCDPWDAYVWQITQAGMDALSAYEARYGVARPAWV